MATIVGDANNDTLSGTNSDDLISGLEGNDSLTGLQGNDSLDGGIGSDTLIGSQGDDSLIGGDGDDSIQGGSENDALNGGAGDDTLVSGVGADTLTGGAGDDIYNLDDAGDIVIENPGEGNDTVKTAFSDYTLGANLENLNYLGAAAFSGTGNELDNKITGGAENDTLTGGAGNDAFNGFSGADFVDGGIGTDVIVLSKTSAALNAATDTQIVDVEGVTAAGTPTAVVIDLHNQSDHFEITGTDSADTLIGGSGGDTFVGFSGADVLDGGTGPFANTLALSATSADLNAATDAQIVHVQSISAADAAAGVNINLGNQSEPFAISGSNSADTLTGTPGNDNFVGFVGADSIDGGSGFDWITLAATSPDLNSAADAQIIGAEYVTASFAAAGVLIDVHSQTENISIIGNNFDDTVIGNGADNSIDGRSGADSLSGDAGNDNISGGAGADSMQGGAGNDQFNDFTGADTVDGGSDNGGFIFFPNVFVGGPAGDQINLSQTSADLNNATDGQIIDVEVVSAWITALPVVIDLHNQSEGLFILGSSLSTASDTLTGGAGDDTLDGVRGGDVLAGGLGNDEYRIDNVGDSVTENPGEGTDTIVTNLAAYMLGSNFENLAYVGFSAFSGTGNNAANHIWGGAGDDMLDAGDGNDTITSSAGNDTMTGGIGDDVFAGLDLVYGVDSVSDHITDFGEGGDSVDLSTVYGFSFIGNAAFSGSAGEIRYAFSGADTEIQFDLDGDGATDSRIVLDNVHVALVETTAGSGILIASLAPTDVVLSSSSVAENSANGTVVGVLSATVPDPGDTFSLIANPEGLFAIDGANLVVAGGLDYEAAISHDVTVRVTDSSNATYDKAFTISVSNVSGVAITGTSKVDIINATHGVVGQPLPTNEEDNINGAGGNDSIDALGGNDTLNGGAGNDTLNGGPGADSLIGVSGNDTYIVDNAGDTITEASGAGTDTVLTTLNLYGLGANVEKLTFTGTGDFAGTGNDLSNALTGGDGNDVLSDALGKDTLNGGGGDDTLSGGDSNDSLLGGDGNDALSGGIGNDTLTGDAGSDTLSGSDGNDTLAGGDGSDSLDGGLGDDKMDGGVGDDTLAGAYGNDTYFVDSQSDIIVEASGDGTDTVKATASAYALASYIENLTFTGVGDFAGTGNDLANAIMGGAGNDTLTGGDGNDKLAGSDGNDSLDGGLGNDKMDGGNGDDTIEGGAGKNNLFGNDGDDSIFGGDGNDTIAGGAGVDRVGGGVGADRFAFGPDEFAAGPAFDEIVDFSHAEKDKISLSAIDAVAGGLDNKFLFIGSAGFSGVAGQLHYVVNPGGGVTVEGDTNGDGAADFSLIVDGVSSLVAGDFIL